MKKTYKILLLIFFISTFAGFAQKGEDPSNQSSQNAEQARIEQLKNKPLHGFFGLGFSNSIPQDDYMTNMNTSAPGFGLYGGYRFEPIPLTVGAQVDMLFFGSETKYIKYTLPNGWSYAYDTLSTTTFSVPFSVFARLEQNVYNLIFPYIEGTVGFSVMSASADYSSFYGVNDNKHEISTNIFYGLGVGSMFKLTDFINLPNNISRMLLDVKFRYIKGSNAEYYTVKSFNDGSVKFDKYKSLTNQVTFNLGLVFMFGQ